MERLLPMKSPLTPTTFVSKLFLLIIKALSFLEGSARDSGSKSGCSGSTNYYDLFG